ncbi:lachesin-like isoform X2 [Linepithema humile]|uniref:lachesin-like isoform X2 n=1 Tax=Linepithema humile TaxID=83485 RepID=UPI00062374A2|nr:PREDICTED: lachesin-like [Linepithema humile]
MMIFTRMRVARLLLCCVLLEDYSTNLGGTAITSDAMRQDGLSSATNPTQSDVPSFSEPIGNVTAAIGKEVALSCTIRKVGNYKVGWLRAEDQTILSMGDRRVTHSPRFFVTLENAKTKNQTQSREDEEATWQLHIRALKEADRGCYMCQLNTKPMLSQLGCVDVLVPPDILSSGTSDGEVSVLEGENATLSCKASGRPPPRVFWRREKSDFILMRGFHDPLIQVDNLSGERLELTRVDRRQMGAYLCIARNEVPPAVSKRVNLKVNFAPTAKAPNQLLSSPLDTNVSLICLIEAYPKTINLWMRKEQVIMSGGRYEIDERGDPDEEWKTTIVLKIRRLEKTDLGEYTCSASSSMGKAEATLRVYEIQRPVTVPTRVTSTNWKRINGSKSKPGRGTIGINRVFNQQSSTPAMQKSTARLFYNNRYATTSTTVDPRAPLIKDHGNAYKHNNHRNDNHQDLKDRSDAAANVSSKQLVLPFCLILFLTVR